jgi:lipoprotein-anchoring transpeptidase ErfK/SrfK
MMLAAVAVGSAGLAIAQAPPTNSAAPAAKPFAAPGTPGSPINGETFHAQVLLDVAGFPAGVIDGKKGMSFAQALRGFQEARGLDTTGKLDAPTRQALLSQNRVSTIMVKLSADQVAGPFINPIPKDTAEKAKLPGLYYRNMLEKVAEEFHTTPDTVVALNGRDARIGEGQTLRLPNVAPASRDYGNSAKGDVVSLMGLLNVAAGDIKGKSVVVDKSEGVLKVIGDNDQIVAQFPVTMGSTHDPLPLGNWKVTTYAFLPPFHYQPDLFWDAKDKTADDKMLKPGPNGPVGVAWLDLNKEHYGIHGTPEPSTIGRAESHGCIRMTNWDVLRLSQMLKPGFKALFQA